MSSTRTTNKASPVFNSFQEELASFQTNATSANSLHATQELIKKLEAIDESSPNLSNQDEIKVDRLVTDWKQTVLKTQKRTNTQITKILKYLDNNVYSFDIMDELRSSGEQGLSNFKLNVISLSFNNQKLINQVIYAHLEKYGKDNVNVTDDLLKLLRTRFGILSAESVDEQINNDELFKGKIEFLSEMFQCFKNAEDTDITSPLSCWNRIINWLRSQHLNELLVNLHIFLFVRIYLHKGRDKAMDYYQSNVEEFKLDSTFDRIIGIESLIKLYDQKIPDYNDHANKVLANLENSTLSLFKNLSIMYCKINRLKSFKLKKNEINELPDSQLFNILMASMLSLPKIHKFVKQFNIKKKLSTSNDELVIELPAYIKDTHPIFICPVSKQETTAENPPMKLNCNHIISKESIKKLIESKRRESFIRGGTISLMQGNNRADSRELSTADDSAGYDDEYESDEIYDIEEDDQEDIVLDMDDETMESVRYIYATEITNSETGLMQAPRNMDDDAELARQSMFYRRERRRMRSGVNLDSRAERQRRRRLRQREIIRRREEEEERERYNMRSIRTSASMLEADRLRTRSIFAGVENLDDNEQDDDEDEELENLPLSENEELETDFDYSENEHEIIHNESLDSENNTSSGLDYLRTPDYMNDDSGVLQGSSRGSTDASTASSSMNLNSDISTNLKISFKCPYCPTTCSGIYCQRVSFKKC